jgi:hypothetical protein
MDEEKLIRAVAVLAAALQPHPGNLDLLTRAEYFGRYIHTGDKPHYEGIAHERKQ